MSQFNNTILIVEDNHTIMSTIVRSLESRFNLIIAYTVEEFLERREIPHDLTIMDYNLDEYYLGADLIKSAESSVIMLTSQTDFDIELKCLRAGAVDYIRKPFHPEILMHRVSMHIDIIQTRMTLEQFSFEDKLTQIKNRRALERDMDLFLMVNSRDKASVGGAFMLMDIDHFKFVNDEYGHDVGDIVLTAFASIVKKICKRVTDGVYRWGGEEFVVTVNSCTQEQALNLAELIRRTVEKHQITIPNGTITKTVSLGVVFFTWDKYNLESAYKTADNLLYQAKESGRNKVLLSQL